MSYDVRVTKINGHIFIAAESITELALSPDRSDAERAILRKLLLDAQEVTKSLGTPIFPW